MTNPKRLTYELFLLLEIINYYCVYFNYFYTRYRMCKYIYFDPIIPGLLSTTLNLYVSHDKSGGHIIIR